MAALSGISEELAQLDGQVADIFRALSNGFQKLEKMKDSNRQSRQLEELTDKMRDCDCKREWIPARLDCKKVLKHDPSKAKAHCILGICLREMGEFQECVKELEKALELAKHQNVPFDDFTDLNSIRKELVKANDSRLLELEELRKACRFKIEEQLKYDLSRARKDYCSQLKLIDELFSKALKAEQPKEVPDFLICPITLDVFTDPVITPCGQTYDRHAILQHLVVQETPFDPKTRQPLRVDQLIANNAIRRCVDYYRQD